MCSVFELPNKLLILKFQTSAIYMVVAVSTERYRAVCHPLMRRQAYYKYIIIVVILSITIEFPRFFEMKLINDNSAYWTTDLMENPDYVLFSSYWNDIIVTGLLPLVLLCYLNLRVFIKIKVSLLPNSLLWIFTLLDNKLSGSPKSTIFGQKSTNTK